MASGFDPGGQTAYNTTRHILPFQDHAGSHALSVWRGRAINPLPRLNSYTIYPSTQASPWRMLTRSTYTRAVTDDPLYGSNDIEYRLDLYIIPGGSENDCINHFRVEKKLRGRFENQIELVSTNVEPIGRLPDLSRHTYTDTAQHPYHSLNYMFSEANWSSGNQLIARVEFDPLSQAEYEAGSKNPDDPHEPNVLPEKKVTIEAINSKSLNYDSSGIRLMSQHLWDRAPRQSMGRRCVQAGNSKRVDGLLKVVIVHFSHFESDVALR